MPHESNEYPHYTNKCLVASNNSFVPINQVPLRLELNNDFPLTYRIVDKNMIIFQWNNKYS